MKLKRYQCTSMLIVQFFLPKSNFGGILIFSIIFKDTKRNSSSLGPVYGEASSLFLGQILNNI